MTSSDSTLGTESEWFGHRRWSGAVGGRSMDVVSVPVGRWSAKHQRNLLGTRFAAGLVPTLGLRRTSGRVDACQLPAPGSSLGEAVERGELAGVDEISGAIECAARAVHEGHRLGLTHGALASEDVRVQGRHVSVAGMGLGVGGTPGPGRALGVAPEVAGGAQPTVAADVFSLGRLLEETLADRPDEISAEARSLIDRSTAPEPTRRPASAAAFADELARLRSGDVGRTPFVLAALGGGVAATGLTRELAGSGSEVGTMVGVGSMADEGSGQTGRSGRRVAGWALAGITALGGLGLQALAGDGSPTDGTAGTVPTTVVPSTVVPTTSVTSTSVTATSVAPSNVVGPATVSSTAGPVGATPRRPGELSTQDAVGSFEILHAVPATPVDAYIEGELVAAGFAPGTLAGPLPLTDTGRLLQLFGAVDDPGEQTIERDDAALLEAVLEPDGAGAVVAYPGPDGVLRLEHFAYDLEPVAAGRSRLALQHVAAAGPIAVAVDGRRLTTALEPGGVVVVEVGPGPHRIGVSDVAGGLLLDQAVDSLEGELTATWIRGGGGEPFTTSIRRVAGLQTAPSGIPSGDSGLADLPENRGLRSAVAVMVVLFASGWGWHRRWLRGPGIQLDGRPPSP